MYYQETELTDSQAIVNHFADYFSSVFTCDNSHSDSVFVCDKGSDITNVLHNFVISDCDINRAVKKIKPNLTMGPDGVPAFFIKDCVTCLLQPLCFLFNLIICKATFPDRWKTAKVVPVYKSGDKHNIQNYRPIAIISNFSKLFESILSNVLYRHVSPMISTCQHGFIKGRSTSTNLCEYVQFISNALEARTQVDVIYTDLSKAFDTVKHDVLINKLLSFGICNNLLNLFRSLLLNREQYV